MGVQYCVVHCTNLQLNVYQKCGIMGNMPAEARGQSKNHKQKTNTTAVLWQCAKCGRFFKKTNQSHYCNDKPSSIDEYIAAQPEDVRSILCKIRKTIQKAAPKAVEKISWSMPTFWQNGYIIHFAAFKKHIGIYPGDLSHTPFEQKLSGYRTTKGAVQFPLNKPIDYSLIAEITRFRVQAVSGE